MSIDVQTVAKLAELSRFELAEGEAEKMAAELEKIRQFVAQLQEVDTSDVTPMASTVSGHSTREREDEVSEETRRGDYMGTAPSSEMGFFVVPRVVE